MVLVDDDPVFRMGLSAALRSQPHWQIVAEVSRHELLDCLARLAETDLDPTAALLEPFLPARPDLDPLTFCRELRQAYPDLPVLLFTGSADGAAIASLQALDLAGYRPKGCAIDDLLAALQQVLAGASAWPPGTAPLTEITSTSLERAPTWLLELRRTGLRQIDRQLAQVQAELARGALSNWDWLFWSGRQRELRATRWLVRHLLPVEVTVAPAAEPAAVGSAPDSEAATPTEELATANAAPATALTAPDRNLPARSPSRLAALRARLQLGSRNQTGTPLEIDILQPAKRQELLYLTLRELDSLLEELRFLDVTKTELRERQPLIRRELWQSTVLAFAGKYYTPEAEGAALVDRLVQGFPVVEATVLSRMPLLPELFAYLLYNEPLVVDNVAYRPESPEAQTQAELLLTNLIVQVANGTMQFLLNQFPEAESIKYSLYARAYLSSREIARLRNELSWAYRQNFYFGEPRAIFESQYRLFELRDGQLRQTAIYAPRNAELAQLRGVRWLVTIGLEARDALGPRLRGAIAWLGSGAVYVLTQVVGKAIGLIGRGMLQGLGNAVQESRYRKK